MQINMQTVGALEENTYFVTDENTKDTIVIDPGAQPERLINVIKENGYNLKYIVLTHAHFDHIGACQKIIENFGVPIVLGEGEEILLEYPENNLSAVYGKEIKLKGDIYLKDNEVFKINENFYFNAIKTTGHTPGGISIYFEKDGVVFTGDTLFCGTIGRTDLPYGNSSDIINSIKKLKLLPDTTVVYAGHGEKTTIGKEKATNPYMQENFYN